MSKEIKREEAKELFRSDLDSYGKPKKIMTKIDMIYDSFEKAKSLMTKDVEDVVVDYFKEGFEKEPMKALQTVLLILNHYSKEMGSGQLNGSFSDKDDKKTATLLFTTDEEMLPLLDKFINDFDKEVI